MERDLQPFVGCNKSQNHENECVDDIHNFIDSNVRNHGRIIDDSSEEFKPSKHCESLYPGLADDDTSLLDPLLPNANVEMPQVDIRSPNDISARRKYLSVFVLFLINLLNYMDRFTIAGVLLSIQVYFGVDNASAGLLQTVFIVSYMLVAPIFGYLGDRYNRKVLMLIGMLVWSGCTLLSSFISNKSDFLWFLALRGLVGIGEASYSTIAPTIIADLFVKTRRTRMLSVFFFATPVGSGLGYVVGSEAAKIGGSWQWALRVTPALGVITIILMLFIIPNPRRGASETEEELTVKKGLDKNRTSYLKDLKYILRNPTFVWVTIGVTFMAFVTGCLTLWGPSFVAYSQIVAERIQPCATDACVYTGISFIFGLITCFGGFVGVWTGAESARKWKDKGNKEADAHVCAIGLIVAAPLMYAAFHFATTNVNVAWVFIFFADVCLCFTWTLVTDITLYVTLPMRRSTAQAVQILTMHLLGDAGSPYLIGVISDRIALNMPDTYYTKYISLLRAFYCNLFATVLGGGGFLIASLYLMRDKKRVDDFLKNDMRSNSASSATTSSESSTSGEIDLLLPNNAENAQKAFDLAFAPAENPSFASEPFDDATTNVFGNGLQTVNSHGDVSRYYESPNVVKAPFMDSSATVA